MKDPTNNEDVRNLGLTGKDRLRPRAGISIRIESNGDVCVETDRGSRVYPGRVLRIVDEFRTGREIRRVLEVIGSQAAGKQDWLEMWTTVLQMYADGLLVKDGEKADRTQNDHLQGFSTPRAHIEMLDDCTRTSAFLSAIKTKVNPGDVVVDLGTGSGILALAAARAGAKRVFSIEAGKISTAAREVIRTNGFSEVVRIIEGWSHRVNLEEKADVLVTETVGNHTLGERIVESVADARRRFLKPGAIVIPEVIHVSAVPIELPESEWANHVFSPEKVDLWAESYGFRFGQLTSFGKGFPRSFWVPRPKARQWKTLAAATRLLSVDLTDVQDPPFETKTQVTFSRSGRFNAVLVFSEIDLAPRLGLTIDPWVDGGPTSWRTPVWLDGCVHEVRSGDTIEMTYQYPQRQGLVTWNINV